MFVMVVLLILLALLGRSIQASPTLALVRAKFLLALMLALVLMHRMS